MEESVDVRTVFEKRDALHSVRVSIARVPASKREVGGTGCGFYAKAVVTRPRLAMLRDGSLSDVTRHVWSNCWPEMHSSDSERDALFHLVPRLKNAYVDMWISTAELDAAFGAAEGAMR